jgi:hypothetical protein
MSIGEIIYSPNLLKGGKHTRRFALLAALAAVLSVGVVLSSKAEAGCYR